MYYLVWLKKSSIFMCTIYLQIFEYECYSLGIEYVYILGAFTNYVNKILASQIKEEENTFWLLERLLR